MPLYNQAMGTLPTHIERYQLAEQIGQGAFSAVFRAVDAASGQVMAIKLLNPGLEEGEQASVLRDRFLQEGRIAQKLKHPNIAGVHAVGEQDGWLYHVQDYVGGQSLRAWLNTQLAAEHFPDLKVVVNVIAQCANSLGYAHEQGVLHGDLKPENVLLVETNRQDDHPAYRAMLIDFGMALDDTSDERSRSAGSRKIFGTLVYMSPEQIRGEALDGRTDIYSLGVMLYELVTGQPPFISDSAAEMMMSHTRAEARRPQDLRPDAPNALISIIYQSMLKLTRDRYESMSDLARELSALDQVMQRTGHIDPIRYRLKPPPVREGEATVYDVLPSLDRPPLPVNLITDPEQPSLIITMPDADTNSVRINNFPFTIGRGSGNDLVLNDPRVSRHHARIEQLDDSALILTDAGSANGTFLGGHRLEKNMTATWDDLDSARIGPYWLILRTPRAPQLSFTAEFSVASNSVALLIENNDREARTFTVELRERGNALILAPGRTRLSIPANDERRLNIGVTPKRRRWIGAPTTHILEGTIRASGASPQAISAVYTVQPPLTWWAPLLLIPIVITVVLYLLAGV